MKLTKLFAVMLALVLVFSLVACSDEGSEGGETTANTTGANTSETTTKVDDATNGTTLGDTESDTTVDDTTSDTEAKTETSDTAADTTSDVTTDSETETADTTSDDTTADVTTENVTTDTDTESETSSDDTADTTEAGIDESELFILELDGIFDDPTFAGGTNMFTKVNHGDVVLGGSQMKVTVDPSVDQINMQEWEHQTVYSAGTYEVYFRATVIGDQPTWAIFKIGSDANQAKVHGLFDGIGQRVTIEYDGVANKSFQFAAGFADGASGTIVFDYIQLVRVS